MVSLFVLIVCIEGNSMDESIIKELPKSMLQKQDNSKVEEPSVSQESLESERETKVSKEESEGDDNMYENENLPENPLNQTEEIKPKKEEPVLEGERPGSPIIPALRNKLIHSQTIQDINRQKDFEGKEKPK